MWDTSDQIYGFLIIIYFLIFLFGRWSVVKVLNHNAAIQSINLTKKVYYTYSQRESEDATVMMNGSKEKLWWMEGRKSSVSKCNGISLSLSLSWFKMENTNDETMYFSLKLYTVQSSWRLVVHLFYWKIFLIGILIIIVIK